MYAGCAQSCFSGPKTVLQWIIQVEVAAAGCVCVCVFTWMGCPRKARTPRGPVPAIPFVEHLPIQSFVAFSARLSFDSGPGLFIVLWTISFCNNVFFF